MSISLACLAACGTKTLPPMIADFDGGAVDLPPRDACVNVATPPPSPDAEGYCGNVFLNAVSDPPNVYFVLDRSGSMQEFVDGREKYAALAEAIVRLMRSLGAKANVGAAVFPGRAVDIEHPCLVGEQVYPASPGDPVGSSLCGDDGPATKAFATNISLPSGVRPNGATPTAATLTALRPIITALPGKTVVILATDGGPNCNRTADCTADKCIPNIEKVEGCTQQVNCCADDLGGPSSCLDEDPTRRAVENLASDGIKTYVIGIPGSSPYGALLDQLAVAGGTARATSPAYYDVAHIVELDDALDAIGSKVTLSCHLHLDAPPPDPGFVNVYLDRRLLENGSPDGWTWGDFDGDAGAESTTDGNAGIFDGDAVTSEARAVSHLQIELGARACKALESGEVRRVQVVFGCPTEIAR